MITNNDLNKQLTNELNVIFKTGEVNDDIMTYILQSTKSITPSD